MEKLEGKSKFITSIAQIGGMSSFRERFYPKHRLGVKGGANGDGRRQRGFLKNNPGKGEKNLLVQFKGIPIRHACDEITHAAFQGVVELILAYLP